MGYAWGGQCYETASQAFDSFVRKFPSSDAYGVTTFSGTPPSVNGSGLITLQSSYAPWTGGSSGTLTYVIKTGTVQLPSCTYDSMGSFWTSDIVFLCAMVFAAFVGFKTGFRP